MRAEPQSGTIRPPAVAGMFYRNNPDRLRTEVLDLLAEVAPPRKPTPKALDRAACRLYLLGQRCRRGVRDASRQRAARSSVSC